MEFFKQNNAKWTTRIFSFFSFLFFLVLMRLLLRDGGQSARAEQHRERAQAAEVAQRLEHVQAKPEDVKQEKNGAKSAHEAKREERVDAARQPAQIDANRQELYTY